MISVFGAFANTRSVGKPKTRTLGLFLGDFEPFLSPYRVNAILSYIPAFGSQEIGYLPISVTTEFRGNCHHSLAESLLLLIWFYLVPLSESDLPDCPASASLTDAKLIPDVGHSFALACRA
jgi:hypothetical protein